MKGKVAFVVGVGVGYLAGTHAGRQQFDKIKGFASDVWNDPRVQTYVRDMEGQAKDFAKQQGTALKDKAFDAAKSAAKSGGSSAGAGTKASGNSGTTADGTSWSSTPGEPFHDTAADDNGTR